MFATIITPSTYITLILTNRLPRGIDRIMIPVEQLLALRGAGKDA
jgi:hypothetical protein